MSTSASHPAFPRHYLMRKTFVAALLFSLVAGSGAPHAQAQTAPPADTSSSRVVILGTGTPNADPARSGPALAIVVNNTSYLIDCGPGIVRRAAAAQQQKGIEALAPPRLTRVFLTHLHSDHTLGCPDLLLSPWVLERQVPLEVYGPEGTANMFEHIRKAYREDIRNRLYGLEPANTEGHKAVVEEIQPGLVYQDENVRVYAFAVHHGSWPYSFGYRFETPDRTIVISGDATPSEAIVEQCNGCDVLIHEVYSAEQFQQRSPEWQRYHAASHTSTIEVAELAKRAQPELLVLYHQLFWGATDEDLLREVREHYSGRVVSARDLDVF